MKKIELTKKSIIETVKKSHPKSLSGLYRSLGGTGKLSGSTAKKIRTLVPDIQERIDGCKDLKSQPSTIRTSEELPKKKTYARHPKNPFRAGSGYAIAFDILAVYTKGLRKDKWAKLYMAQTGKSARLARFDMCVLMSGKESITSERHRSCRDGFWIKRTADHVQLILK